jgi:hypothetical protein
MTKVRASPSVNAPKALKATCGSVIPALGRGHKFTGRQREPAGLLKLCERIPQGFNALVDVTAAKEIISPSARDTLNTLGSASGTCMLSWAPNRPPP